MQEECLKKRKEDERLYTFLPFMEYFVKKDFKTIIFLVIFYFKHFVEKIHLEYTSVYEKSFLFTCELYVKKKKNVKKTQ